MLRNSRGLNNTNSISWLAARYVGQQFCTGKHMLFSNLCEISSLRTAKTASSCNLEIAVMDALLFLFVCFCFTYFPAAVAPSTVLHVAVSVVGVCARTWMTMCFQQMAFLLPALWRNLSSFLRLLSHNTSAALIPAKRNAAITLSPRHPGRGWPARQLSRSGAFSRTD